MRADEITLNEDIELGDSFDIELGGTVIETGVVGFMPDGVIVEADAKTLILLNVSGALFESGYRHGLPDPDAPRLGDRSRADVTGEDEPPGMFMVVIDGRAWKEFTSNKAFAVASTFARKNPTKKVQVRWPNGQLNSINEEDTVDEAKYHGKEVPLGKKLPGDVKKSKVYVRKPNGKIVKVNFGDKNMRIKKSIPARRRSFRARHHCENPGPRWKARYWSCRSW
jgi:hypothetical protein